MQLMVDRVEMIFARGPSLCREPESMDEHGQCFVIKFLWLQEHDSKVIPAQLRRRLGICVVSLPTVKR
jgi:hypothetical protein